MRIISGKAKGRKLLSPQNEGRKVEKGDLHATRPTLDRVKEAMFNIISRKIPDASVLDMFAGTGSLGLECASRGADKVILLEKFRESYEFLLQNIENLGFSDVAEAVFTDAYNYSRILSSKGEKFDIIFVDPPYLNNMVRTSVDLIEELGLLTDDGVIVAKFDSTEEVYEPQGLLELVDQRKYGKTILGFYQLKEVK